MEIRSSRKITDTILACLSLRLHRAKSLDDARIACVFDLHTRRYGEHIGSYEASDEDLGMYLGR